MGIQINDPDFMEKFLAQHKTLQENRSIILSKIQPWLDSVKQSDSSKIEKKQKTKEIIDIGNFLHFYDKEIKIIDALTESPDFIVSKNKIMIGIELKDLIIRTAEKEKEGVFKTLFEQIKIELENNIEKYKGHYRIEFLSENFTLKSKDKNQIKKEIISTINGESQDKKYIKKVIKKPYSGISLYKGEATVVGALKRNVVEREIKSKERKFDNYKSEKLQEIWLLLVIGGVEKSSDYSFIEESITSEPFESNFHRIFLYDFYERKVNELKITPHNTR